MARQLSMQMIELFLRSLTFEEIISNLTEENLKKIENLLVFSNQYQNKLKELLNFEKKSISLLKEIFPEENHDPKYHRTLPFNVLGYYDCRENTISSHNDNVKKYIFDIMESYDPVLNSLMLLKEGAKREFLLASCPEDLKKVLLEMEEKAKNTDDLNF
jgi:hypothetical protein